jgi:hypothetical protein
MPRQKWPVILFAAAIAGGAIYASRPPVSAVNLGLECLHIYRDIIPKGAELTTPVLNSQTLDANYRHAKGEGAVTCDLANGVKLDFDATMNRKIDIMWADPTLVPRVEDLD